MKKTFIYTNIKIKNKQSVGWSVEKDDFKDNDLKYIFKNIVRTVVENETSSENIIFVFQEKILNSFYLFFGEKTRFDATGRLGGWLFIIKEGKIAKKDDLKNFVSDNDLEILSNSFDDLPLDNQKLSTFYFSTGNLDNKQIQKKISKTINKNANLQQLSLFLTIFVAFILEFYFLSTPFAKLKNQTEQYQITEKKYITLLSKLKKRKSYLKKITQTNKIKEKEKIKTLKYKCILLNNFYKNLCEKGEL